MPPGPACDVPGLPQVHSRRHPLGGGRRPLSCPPAGIPTGGFLLGCPHARVQQGRVWFLLSPRGWFHICFQPGMVLVSSGVNSALRRAVCSPAASQGFLFSSSWGFRACRFVSLPRPHVEPGPHRPEGFLARRGWWRNDFPSFALNLMPLIPRGCVAGSSQSARPRSRGQGVFAFNGSAKGKRSRASEIAAGRSRSAGLGHSQQPKGITGAGARG